MEDHAGLTALAEAMQARIDWLGMTVLDVAHRGGPQRGALHAILNATRMPRPATLEELDTVLGWPDGTAHGVLEQRIDAPEPDQWPELVDENRLGVIRSELLRLRREQGRVAERVQSWGARLDKLTELLDEHMRRR